MNQERLSRAEVAARLADVERHLREVPPHSGEGLRDDLLRQRAQLQRQIASLDAARATDGGQDE